MGQLKTYLLKEKRHVDWRQLGLQSIILLCILLFVYAAMSKVLDYGKFKIQISQAAPLKSYAGVLAVVIPAAELGIAALLASSGKFRYWGLVAFTGLMTCFTGYIIWAYFFSPNTPCSCGGVLESLGWLEHLYFNIVFILLGLLGIYLIQKNKKGGL